MERRTNTALAMRKSFIMLAMAAMATGCYKDTLDVAALDNNPFDPAYAGPPVFEVRSTYLETVTIAGLGTITRQVFEFRVRNELFLAPARYSVQVLDLTNDIVSVVDQSAPDDHILKYYRLGNPAPQLCVELRLRNNFSNARAETLCADL